MAANGETDIRIADVRDASEVAAIYRPYVADAVTSFEIDPPDAAEMARRIQSVLAFAPWLVATDGNGNLAGYAYATRHHERPAYMWSVDVTVYIGGAHQRRGIGRALYERLFSLMRLQGYYVAHAGITLPNAASVGLHETMGFRTVGTYPAVGWKLGAWRDVGWWHLPLQERPPAPAQPLSFTAVQALPAWAEIMRQHR